MAQYSKLPVYKASYDLLLEIFRFTKDFTKEYKYTVGETARQADGGVGICFPWYFTAKG